MVGSIAISAPPIVNKNRHTEADTDWKHQCGKQASRRCRSYLNLFWRGLCVPGAGGERAVKIVDLLGNIVPQVELFRPCTGPHASAGTLFFVREQRGKQASKIENIAGLECEAGIAQS